MINFLFLLDKFKIDGYIIPKNDEYFNEYISPSEDRLKFLSNFSGSAGFAIILKNKKYLFVDGRYSIQAKKQSGKKFKIITIPNKFPKDVIKPKKEIIIGFDPKLHTERELKFLFNISNVKLRPVLTNLIDKIWLGRKKRNPNLSSQFLKGKRELHMIRRFFRLKNLSIKIKVIYY